MDRQFALQSAITGRPLTLKSHPQLTLCIPFVDLESNWMTVQAPGMKTILAINYHTHQVLLKREGELITIEDLERSIESKTSSDISLPIQICLDCQHSCHLSPVADQWFSEYLQQKCYLVARQNEANSLPEVGNSQSSFSNSGQFLLVSEESVKSLQDMVSD